MSAIGRLGRWTAAHRLARSGPLPPKAMGIILGIAVLLTPLHRIPPDTRSGHAIRGTR